MAYRVRYVDALAYLAVEDREVVKTHMRTSGIVAGISGFGVTFVSGTTFRFAPGRATIDSADGGSFVVTSTAAEDLTFASVPGVAGQSRYDRVIARVYDNTQDALGMNKFQLEIVQGVASATPVEPALPINCLEIGRFVFENGITPSTMSFTDRRKFGAAEGGIAKALNNGLYPANPVVGDIVYDVWLDDFFRWNGSTWVALVSPNFNPSIAVGDQAAANTILNGNQLYARNGAVNNGILYLNHASQGQGPDSSGFYDQVRMGKNGTLRFGGIGPNQCDQINTLSGSTMYLRLNWETIPGFAPQPVAIGPASGPNTLIRPGLDVTGHIGATGNIDGVNLIASNEVYCVQGRIGNQGAANTVLTGNHLYARNGGTANGTLNLNVSVGAVSIGGDVTINGRMDSICPTGSASTTATLVSAGGGYYRLRAVTSSRKYKEEIEDLDINVADILALRPRTFKRNDAVDLEGNYIPVSDAPREAGFIAEEADDLGLHHWVVKDFEGEVDGFSYQTFVVAQQAVLRNQQKRIEDLEAKVEALMAMLGEK